MKIAVDYNSEKKLLVMKADFMYLDVVRSFPSRRFDPKTKTWRMPLVRSNVRHMADLEGRVQFDITPLALDAIHSLDALTAAPVYKAFPRDWFDDKSFKPMVHQWEMLDRGWTVDRYALFATMGTGKTFTTVQLAMLRFARGEVGRVMIICPQTLRNTWKREFHKWADPEKFTIFEHSTAAGRNGALGRWMKGEEKKLHILLVGVEGLGISPIYYEAALEFVAAYKYLMTVCDESSRIKNPDANRTERAIMLASTSKYRMILNGTPIALGLHDLWSQYEFIDPNIIGSGDYWAFKSRYVVMGGFENRQIVGYANTEELMRLVSPYTLEVGKGVLNLPDKLFKTIEVPATKEQHALFDKITSGVGEGDAISVKNVLEKMLRLQQVVGGFEPQTDIETDITTVTPLKENPKLDAMLELIDDHYVGHKFIIWVRYIHEIEMVYTALTRKYGSESIETYYGGTEGEDRIRAERRYNTDKSCRFLIGNPSAAGLGLTLISGENDVMVYYSGTFAFIDRAQSEDRSHRIGQHNTVTIVDLVIEKSIDKAIQDSISSKLSMDQWVKKQLAEGKPLYGG